jgi:bacteriocin biosynthesis cyclodehydratase domain-containing protein
MNDGKSNPFIIKPGFSFHQVESDRAILLHETQSSSLLGELYVHVLSEINDDSAGDRVETDEDFVSRLESKFPSAEIYFALYQLERMGYIVRRKELSKKYTWWSLFGQGKAIEGIFNNPIAVQCSSLQVRQVMEKSLQEAGFWKIVKAPESNVTLVLCSDYLEPEATRLLTDAFNQGTSFCFPIKISGKILWLGPLLRRGQKPCWNCLVSAVKKNRPVENFLSRNAGKPILPDSTHSPVSLQFDISTAITQLVKKMVSGAGDDCELITVNRWDLSVERHFVRARPQCDICGDPSLFSKQVNNPVMLYDLEPNFTKNGGYRIVSPEKTWENYKHLVSPISGVITHIDTYEKKNHRLRPVWKATYFEDTHQVTVARQERFVENSYGKGRTPEQSRASALCEAIERYSSIFTGEEPVIRETFNTLKPSAIDPSTLQHFSSQQYASRIWLNSLESPQKIPLPFDPDKKISWTPVWSITSNAVRYAPLQYCYSLTPTAPDEDMCLFSSNGGAAGNCVEEALLQGLLELVERDATAIWWYNRVQRPEIDLESFNDDYFNEIKKHYKELGWNLWLLDLTHDLRIPSVVALAKNEESKNFTIGLGCHLDMYLAIQRAITEMHQIFDPANTHNPVWTEDEIKNPRFLFPDGHEKVCAKDWQSIPKRSLKDDISECAEKIKNAGMDLFVLNFTRPDIGVPCVKAIVPGLRHFWKQLGPGRLYSAPVALGWLSEELMENAMNPKELPL